MEWIYDDGGRSKYFKAEKVGDCVTRAICNATGKDYKEVYDALNDLAKKERAGKRKRGRSSSRDGVYTATAKKYIEQVLGWKWTPCMTIGSGCKVHVRSEELPSGNLILNLSRHFSCVKDGILYDTYDCSRDGTRCVYGYWSKPEEKAKGQARNSLNLDIEQFMANLAYGTAVTIIDCETAEVVYETDNFRCPWGTRREYIMAKVECFGIRDNELYVWVRKEVH